MSDIVAERTHPPSPNRRQHFRKQGAVPRSMAVITAAILLGGTIGMLWFGDTVANQLAEQMHQKLQSDVDMYVSQADVVSWGRDGAKVLLVTAGPMLATIGLLAVSGCLLQGICFWLPQKLLPDLGRCNPARNWHRLLSWEQVRDGVWSLCGLTLILFVGVTSLWARRTDLLQIAQIGAAEWPWAFCRAVLETVFHLAIATIFYSVADYALQWRKWHRMLYQTDAEKRQEQRDREGDPLLRSRRRSLHAEYHRHPEE